MKRNVVFVAAGILTIVNLVALGTIMYHRWTGGPSLPDRRDQRFEQMKRELALTTSQAAQLDVNRTLFHAELDSVSGQLTAVRTKLARLLRDDTLDTLQINSHLGDIGRLQSLAQRRVISHLLSVKSILTPEQQTKFFAIVQERFSSESEQPMAGRPSP